MKQALKLFMVTGCALTFIFPAIAKLPALSDEAKAKAAEASAKSAWSAKVEAYQLCKSQDAVAARTKKAKLGERETKPLPPARSCADPGPYMAPPVTGEPLNLAAPASAAGDPAKKP